MLILGHHHLHHLVSFPKEHFKVIFQSDFLTAVFSFFLKESAVWSRMHLRHLAPNYEEFGGEETMARMPCLLLIATSSSLLKPKLRRFLAPLESRGDEDKKRNRKSQLQSLSLGAHTTKSLY